MATNQQTGLQGLRVISFESRRANEMAELIRRYGGEPFIAPSIREVPLRENHAARELLPSLEAGEIDILVLLTGIGTRTLVEAVATQYSKERFTSALRRATLVARGPKPVAALRELGLEPDVVVSEPNTWREILSALDTRADLNGRCVAVQEYGITNHELMDGLRGRGARVLRVPVYRWALPEDTAPLRAAIQKILNSQADIALFTNATQVDHLFGLAAEEKKAESLRHAFGRVLVASVGPVCTEALRHFGLSADLEPAHSKMGHLVAALARRGRALLAAKRRAEP